jgi:hypothetical protein
VTSEQMKQLHDKCSALLQKCMRCEALDASIRQLERDPRNHKLLSKAILDVMPPESVTEAMTDTLVSYLKGVLRSEAEKLEKLL